MNRSSIYRRVFKVGGLYNLAFGVFTLVNPQWLFHYSNLPPINHPAVFSCLGMVIGLYGILYLDVARAPERGFLIAAVGLIGKILGPIGFAYLYFTGQWPLKAGILCLFNDLIWWIPFAFYLFDARTYFRADIYIPKQS
jgi:hypothetical protein